MTRQANELLSLAPSPSRGGRHVELPNQMVGLRTEVPGNGPVGPTVRRLARPLSPAGHRTASVRPHPGSGGDRGVEVEDDKTASRNHDRVRQEGHHAFGSSMRAQTASPLSHCVAPQPVFPSSTAGLGASHWVQDWRPRARCVVVDGPVGLGPGRGREGNARARILLRFFLFFFFFRAGRVCVCVRKLY
jgi:hypothetical protein